MRVRELRREQERQENEPVEDPIMADELINTEFGNPEEIRNRVQGGEMEMVLEIVAANEGTEND